MNILDLPFNQHLGFALTQHEGSEVICLEPETCHLNHVGTVHAGALYALAEAASGHALLDRLASNSADIVAVVRSAKAKYRKPAKGRLIALADLGERNVTTFVDTLKAKSRAMIDIPVRLLSDDCTEVFAGEFTWFASRDKPYQPVDASRSA